MNLSIIIYIIHDDFTAYMGSYHNYFCEIIAIIFWDSSKIFHIHIKYYYKPINYHIDS